MKFVSSLQVCSRLHPIFCITQLFEVNVHYSHAEVSVRMPGIGNFQNTKISSKYIYAKVSFFVQCTKMQLITLQNFNIQICFSQSVWVFSLKFWFIGQIMSRIHLILPKMHTNLCVLIDISMEIGMFNFWSVKIS